MKRHKWKNESFLKYIKEESCVKCGIFRTWEGGDMQCWNYWSPRKSDFESVKTQFERPECIE